MREGLGAKDLFIYNNDDDAGNNDNEIGDDDG